MFDNAFSYGCPEMCFEAGHQNILATVIVIAIFKLLKYHSKAKRRAPAYSRALKIMTQREWNDVLQAKES